jgi:hypothetical protein
LPVLHRRDEDEETEMPTVAEVAVVAVPTLIDELASLQPPQADRMAARRAAQEPAALEARAVALAAITVADRVDLLESAAERLAVAAIAGEVPPPVRLAAYNALVALVASDLLPPATFRALYDAWEQGTHGGSGTDAVLRGEELLLTLD